MYLHKSQFYLSPLFSCSTGVFLFRAAWNVLAVAGGVVGAVVTVVDVIPAVASVCTECYNRVRGGRSGQQDTRRVRRAAAAGRGTRGGSWASCRAGSARRGGGGRPRWGCNLEQGSSL